MNIMKKFTGIGLLVILALALRLINLDKAGGLWYDEMTIYSIASKSFPFGMLQTDSHRFLLFPLYYLVYNLWITLFGDSDIIIRLMSVFFDVLSVIAAYFAGITFAKFLKKDEFFSQKSGLIYALLYTVNSSFIYYAQEAKFYSLTFFLINLLIIFQIKFLEKSNLKTFLPFYIANFLLIYTYTSQILLTLIIQIVTTVYFIFEKKLKENYKFSVILLTAYIPLLIIALCMKNYFSGNFDSVVYDNSFILLAVQNYFTPVLTGIQNNILNFQFVWLKGCLNIIFWIFVIFPISFIISGLVISIKKYKLSKYIIFIPIIYILLHVFASNFSSYKVLVRYTLMILPFILVTASIGICSIENNKIQKTLLILYTIISILGIFSLNGALNIKRPDGYKQVANALISNNVNSHADFILPIRTELLDKYYNIEGKKLSLYILNTEEAQRTYLSQDEISGIKNDRQNIHKHYKKYLLSRKINPELEEYIGKTFLQNSNIVILSDKSISMFSDKQLQEIALSENYEKYPIQFLRLSKLNNDLIKTASKKLNLKKHIIVKNWEIFVFGI